MKADKRVEIAHSRSTNASNKLDIKFTLDLTPIVSKPNVESIKILQKITGIDFQEVITAISVNKAQDRAIDIDDFFNDCVIYDQSKLTTPSQMYSKYCEWCRVNSIVPLPQTGFAKKAGLVAILKRIDGKVARAYTGIGLK